jgi:hypothetical protein
VSPALLFLAAGLALGGTPEGGESPCDTTTVDLRPQGEAVDAVDAFRRSVQHLVTHQLVGLAEERAEAMLHLDEVEADAGSVRLLKKVGSRLEVSYLAVIGHASEGGLRLQFRIRDRLALESESDPRGRSGGDLVWRWPFR